MEKVSYSHARQRFKTILDTVCHDHEPVTIQRKRGESVVVLSEEDYLSLQETAYVMRSPENLRRIMEALNRDIGESLEHVRKTFGI
jgi:antitoxin YefM